MIMYLTDTIVRNSASTFGKAILGAVVFIASMGSVNAAFITGDMGITGAFTHNGAGGDLNLASGLTLNSATGTSGTGDLGATVGFGTGGTVVNGAISLNAFSPITNLLTIGGWQVDLTSLTITDQTSTALNLSGNGFLSGNSFTGTAATWTFSSNTAGGSYSMTVTAVPVPAAVWLFGSGLLGLVGIARRKAA